MHNDDYYLVVSPILISTGKVCDIIKNGENGFLSILHVYNYIVKDVIANVGNVSSKEIQNEYKAEYSIVVCALKYFELCKKADKKFSINN